MKSGIDLCIHSYRPGRHVHASAHNRSGEHLMSCHLTATYLGEVGGFEGEEISRSIAPLARQADMSVGLRSALRCELLKKRILRRT
jgi:hypothetical protein